MTGTGWRADSRVEVAYLDPDGRPTGSTATARAGADGAFTVRLSTSDDVVGTGRHEVRATDGTSTATATYDAR